MADELLDAGAQPAAPAPVRAEEPNPFAERLAADPSLGEVSLAERARLNAYEGAFRGTIAGSTDLAEFKRSLPDQYERITTDLARYETMRGFEGPLEGMAALAGQLGGGLQSPEALINRVPGVASLAERLLSGVAGRIAGAGASQAVVQGVVNPVVQSGEIATGMRKEFSPGETAGAMAGGLVLGGALHGAGEAVGALARRAGKPKDAEVDAAIVQAADARRAVEVRNMAALADEDPSLRSGDTASVTLPEQAVEASAMDAPAVIADLDAAAARAAAEVPDEGIKTGSSSSPPSDVANPLADNGLGGRTDESVKTGSNLGQGDEAQGAGLQLAPEARQVLDQVDPRIAPAIEQALAPAPKRQGLALVRENFDPAAQPKEPGQLDRRAYAIERDGNRVGTAIVAITGDVAEVRDIYGEIPGTSDQRNVLGPGAVSALLRQFLAENPQIRRLTGERVSGARRGGTHDFAGTGEQIEVRLPDVRRGPTAIAQTQGGKPLSLMQFIARNGGLALDGEASARDLGKVFVPGAGPLARKNGRTIDGHWREALIDAGYLPADADGMTARNVEREVFDALDREQRGERLYSAYDDAPATSEIDTLHREVEAEAKKVAKALKKVGIGEREVDPRTLTDAGELMWRGEETDALAAYERAAMMRELADEQGATGARETYGEMPPGWDDDAVLGGAARADSDAPRGAGEDRAGSGPEGGPDRPGGQLPRAGEGGDGLRFRQREPAAGDGQPRRPDALAAAGSGNEAAAEPLLSLQQQAHELADALDVPLRGGRVQGGKAALGQYDMGQDVVRVRNTADFETVAHEAGHALEKRVGAPLTDLINRFARELGPLDYDLQRGDAGEGFAEWMRHAMVNPAMAEQEAPAFAAAFRSFMGAQAPDLLANIERAIAAHQAYLAAPTGAKLEAMVRAPEDESIVRSIREDGLPATIGLYLSRAYERIFDDKAPAARAVRSMVRAMYAQTGERVRLQGADNPENLVRLFSRAQQAAVQDMREGVRPYRGIVPEGPSLSDALATATGAPGILGRWNTQAVATFDQYLVARRAELLYRRFEAGEMERRPIALSAEEVRAQVAEFEAANPTFREASDQVHAFTRQLLRKQYEGGLIDAELYGRLMGQEFYVPLFRHMDDRPGGALGGGGPDGPGQVDTVKTMRGSDRDIIPPTQGLMTQAFLVNRTLAHNDIIKSFVALARQARAVGADGVGRILEEIPPTQMMGKRFDLAEAVASAARTAGVAKDDLDVLTGSLTDVFGDDPIMATIFRAEPTGKRGEPLVFYKDGGQMRAVRLQSAEEGLGLYETIAGLPPVARDMAIQLGAATSTALRAGITTNPTFAITNFIRDQLAVGVLRSDYVPFVSGAKGVWSEITQDKWAGLYAYAGGVSPGAGSAGLSELIDQDISALARRGWAVQKIGGLADLQHGNVLGAAKAVAETVETAEAGTRLAVMKSVFEAKKGQGLSDYDALIEAASQATDVMDFGRHGSGTLYIRTLVPFMNAHLQGLDKGRRALIEPLWRAARGDVVTDADAAALRNAQAGLFKMAGIGGMIGVGYGLWASSHEAYRDANEELRATHLILPGSAFGRDGKVLVIPKPFELAMGFNLGEALGLHLGTGDQRAAHFAMKGMREVLQPPNPLTGIPLVKTAAELALNRSFFTGRDIVPENIQNRENPRFEVKPNTSSLAKAIGGALNISPVKVDYAVGSMFGNWGRDVMAVSNVTDPNAAASANEDTMFLRRFIKGADRTSETTKLFWEQAAQRNGAFAQANQRYGDLLKGFQDREASDYLGSLPAAQRAFVILNQGGDETGKSAFKADEKRLNPIARGALAVQVVNGFIKELGGNTQKTFEDGARFAMNPQKRRDVIDAMRVLSAIEQRNAMVLTDQTGYAGRPLLSAEDQFRVIQAMSPEAAGELATRYATMKVLPTETVARLWPQAQRQLLADGSQADIHDLGLEAKGDGYAFGGDAVKRPQKRRVSITPGVPSVPPTIPARPGGIGEPTKTTSAPNPFQ